MPSVLANRVQVPDCPTSPQCQPKRKRNRTARYVKVQGKLTRGADRRRYHGYKLMRDVVLRVEDLKKTGVHSAQQKADTIFLCLLVIVIAMMVVITSG